MDEGTIPAKNFKIILIIVVSNQSGVGRGFAQKSKLMIFINGLTYN